MYDYGQCVPCRKSKKDLVKYVHRLARLGVLLEYYPNCGFMVCHNVESSLMVAMKSKKHLNLSLMESKESILCKLNELFSLGWMVFRGTKRGYVCPMLMI